MLVHAWCEYDFGGSLGGNNNEEIFRVDSNLSKDEVRTLIFEYIKNASGVEEDEDLEGMWGFDTDFDAVDL